MKIFGIAGASLAIACLSLSRITDGDENLGITESTGGGTAQAEATESTEPTEGTESEELDVLLEPGDDDDDDAGDADADADED